MDAQGTLWALGPFFAQCDLDPGPATALADSGYEFRLQLAARDGSFLAGAAAPYEDGSLVFDSDGATYLSSAPYSGEPLIMKLDPTGASEWTRSYAGTSLIQIALAPSGGVVALGLTGGDPSRASALLMTELDRGGTTRWQVQLPSRQVFPTGIAADAGRFVAVGSNADATMDFDPGPAARLPSNFPTSLLTRYAFER